MDLSSIVAIDQHAHTMLTDVDSQALPLAAVFTERFTSDLVQHHARQTLSYSRSLREIAALLKCDPTEEAIHQCREKIGLESLTKQCIDAANLEAVLLDDGFFPKSSLPWDWHQQFTQVYRLIQVETLAERLMAEVDRFDVFLEWFRSELDPLSHHVIGFTSTAAYRTGLDIQWVYPEVAEACFYEVKQQNGSVQQPIRLTEKVLIDFLVIEALDIAAQHNIPFQFYAGVSSSLVDVQVLNPLHLRPILEEPRYQSIPVVLLYGAYPFMREAGFLSSTYSQVHVDFGRVVSSFSVRGMRHLLHSLMERAPLSKILYSSGAYFLPDLFYLGATWGREVLGQVLDDAVKDGDLSATEAENGAIAILHGNAQRLYFKG